MKSTRRTRNGRTFKQGDFDWIKRLQGLGVDKKGAQRATGWSEDTVGRVFRADTFEQYRKNISSNRPSETPFVASEAQLPLSMTEPVSDLAGMAQVIVLLTSINNHLETIVTGMEHRAVTAIEPVSKKRGWLR